MSSRHEARIWAVQFLFQRDLNHGDLEEDLALFWLERKPAAKPKAFTEDLIRGVEAQKADLDARLQEHAENWDLKRMGGVDRNAMRVALFEMLNRPDIPPVVSINEAVEVCKDLSSDESGKFVNGLLDRIRKDIKRPARAAAVVNLNLRNL